MSNMRRSERNPGEAEKKVGGSEDNAPSMLELSEGLQRVLCMAL
jgi:hypothetical protein